MWRTDHRCAKDKSNKGDFMSTQIVDEYCPLCVGYFEKIKEHNSIKHDKVLINVSGSNLTYDLPFLKRVRDTIVFEERETVDIEGTPA